jgi:hypothetical protein
LNVILEHDIVEPMSLDEVRDSLSRGVQRINQQEKSDIAYGFAMRRAIRPADNAYGGGPVVGGGDGRFESEEGSRLLVEAVPAAEGTRHEDLEGLAAGAAGAGGPALVLVEGGVGLDGHEIGNREGILGDARVVVSDHGLWPVAADDIVRLPQVALDALYPEAEEGHLFLFRRRLARHVAAEGLQEAAMAVEAVAHMGDLAVPPAVDGPLIVSPGDRDDVQPDAVDGVGGRELI